MVDASVVAPPANSDLPVERRTGRLLIVGGQAGGADASLIVDAAWQSFGPRRLIRPGWLTRICAGQ